MSDIDKRTVEFRIRRYLPVDAAVLSKLAARLFVQAYGRTHPEPELSRYLEPSFDAERLTTELAEPGVCGFVAVNDGGEPVGYAYLRERSSDAPPSVGDQRSCEILRFYVDEQWHGRGVANALMKSCEDAARERGAAALWLQVWSAAPRPMRTTRKPASGLWEPQNFTSASASTPII